MASTAGASPTPGAGVARGRIAVPRVLTSPVSCLEGGLLSVAYGGRCVGGTAFACPKARGSRIASAKS